MLAIPCAAAAQSSVTLFGLLDVNISHYSGGSRSRVDSQTALTDGTVNGLNGSRWGIRVAEDLGGGLRASAVLESGVLVDNGTIAQGGRGFSAGSRSSA